LELGFLWLPGAGLMVLQAALERRLIRKKLKRAEIPAEI
jgi:hypothetical protein